MTWGPVSVVTLAGQQAILTRALSVRCVSEQASKQASSRGEYGTSNLNHQYGVRIQDPISACCQAWQTRPSPGATLRLARSPKFAMPQCPQGWRTPSPSGPNPPYISFGFLEASPAGLGRGHWIRDSDWPAVCSCKTAARGGRQGPSPLLCHVLCTYHATRNKAIVYLLRGGNSTFPLLWVLAAWTRARQEIQAGEPPGQTR